MREIHQYFKDKLRAVVKKQDIHVIRAVYDEAYLMTNQVYANPKSFLNDTSIGLKDAWAHLLRAGIAAAAKTYEKKGALCFEVRIRANQIGNSRHIELHRNGKVIYVARVDYPDCIPQKALYRPEPPKIQGDLFNPSEFEDKEIASFVATYGDGGEREFKFGKIGIVGTKSWLASDHLEQGIYTYTTKVEKDEMLVDFADDFAKELGKDENHAEGEKK